MRYQHVVEQRAAKLEGFPVSGPNPTTDQAGAKRLGLASVPICNLLHELAKAVRKHGHSLCRFMQVAIGAGGIRIFSDRYVDTFPAVGYGPGAGDWTSYDRASFNGASHSAS